MKHEAWIKSSPNEVFKALTTKPGISGWWTTETEFNEEQQTITFGFFNKKYWMKFKIIKQEEPKSGEWECIDADEGSKEWIGTKIVFELEVEDQAVRLKFNHNNWPNNALVFARCNSTWGHLMFSLKDYLEKGQGQPMS